MEIKALACEFTVTLRLYRAKVFDRWEATDNRHRGQAPVSRLTQVHPTLLPAHGPVYANWHDQIRIYFRLASARC